MTMPNGDPFGTMISEASAIERYLQVLGLVERLHRRLMDIVKDEFERRGIEELTSAQALLLYNIGDRALSRSEITSRGHHLGHDVTSNVELLTKTGYLRRDRRPEDRRLLHIALTPKGEQVRDIVADLFIKHAGMLNATDGPSSEDIETLGPPMRRLERFWTDVIRYRL